jgi:hypothetical protein
VTAEKLVASAGQAIPATLVEALVAVQGQLPVLAKDKAANYGKYADLVQVHEAVLPLLVEHGLCWTCCPTTLDDGRPVLEYALRHVSGESIGGRYPLPPGASPQQLGSAVTYGRRYSLCAVLGVVADADDDGAAAEASARPARRRATTDDDGRIRPQQRTAVMAGFGELGYGGEENRDRRLQVAARLAGLESLDSVNSLTTTQARAVLDGLAERRKAQRQENPSG